VIYDPEIIDRLQEFEARAWQGIVFRCMLSEFPPDRENSRGGRWNPPETRAIYTSIDRKTVLAEAEYYLRVQPVIPKVARTLYEIDIALSSVLDLSKWNILATLGLKKSSASSSDYAAFQMVGGATEWLGHDGILVPSVRSSGRNLVIFPNRQTTNYRFEVVGAERL
jgi:RES domain-containing protein